MKAHLINTHLLVPRSRSSANWVMWGQKLDHLVKSYKNSVYALEAFFWVQYSGNLLRMFASMKSHMCWKMGHLGLKLGHEVKS